MIHESLFANELFHSTQYNYVTELISPRGNMIINYIYILVTLMQMSMNGYAGFIFGSDRNLVKNMISNKESVVLIKDQKDTLRFAGGVLNGLQVSEWEFVFTKGKLTTLIIEIAGTENDRIMYFASFKKSLVKDYGKYTTIDQHNGNMDLKWFFYFPQGEKTISTYLKLSFSKTRVLIISSGQIL